MGGRDKEGGRGRGQWERSGALARAVGEEVVGAEETEQGSSGNGGDQPAGCGISSSPLSRDALDTRATASPERSER